MRKYRQITMAAKFLTLVLKMCMQKKLPHTHRAYKYLFITFISLVTVMFLTKWRSVFYFSVWAVKFKHFIGKFTNESFKKSYFQKQYRGLNVGYILKYGNYHNFIRKKKNREGKKIFVLPVPGTQKFIFYPGMKLHFMSI